MSIQAFVYSVSCEANEARRLSKRFKVLSSRAAGISSHENSLHSIFSQYGISNIKCEGKLVVMPPPSATEDDGSQPFKGRLGKLRYFGLAVMAAAGAVAADLVQLVLAFPLQYPSYASIQPLRAPIVYPILLGHVLTHITAAICASGGRARARSDSLELVWPIPFSSKGSFVASDHFGVQKRSDSAVDDAEGFIKLGLLARVLQVLLGKLDMISLGHISDDFSVLKTVKIIRDGITKTSSLESQWTLNCALLLEMTLSTSTCSGETSVSQYDEIAIIDGFEKGCVLAAEAACSYLSDIGVVLQLLLPGVVERYASADVIDDVVDNSSAFEILNKLEKAFRLEPLSEILQSDAVQAVVSNWYKVARDFSKATSQPGITISASDAAVSTRLFQTQGFRVFDWPMESSADITNVDRRSGNSKKAKRAIQPDDETGISAMEIDPLYRPAPEGVAHSIRPDAPTPLVTFSSKKSVYLIGGFKPEFSLKNIGRPRILMLPTSYTDLYAELSQLLPESEQTAVCLICGEVLNAGGKGECTKHSYNCGAGSGMFFLLQECAGLIMHNGKAAYIHSPYVDSHGETPQYRGRPLNLDVDRYAHLHEVWSGHAIRQQVLAERGSSRQIIVPDFY